MITPILIFSIIILLIILLLKQAGWLGLYVEVDIKRERMYGWYKGSILYSDGFSLDEPIQDIRLKNLKLTNKCKQQIKKIKSLKSKL